MICACCTGRKYWISEKELSQIQSTELQEQAIQAIELYNEGVIIGEIGQADLFMMDDIEGEFNSPTTTCTGTLIHRGGLTSLGPQQLDMFDEPDNISPKFLQKPRVTFQQEGNGGPMIFEEDDLMCPYSNNEQT